MPRRGRPPAFAGVDRGIFGGGTIEAGGRGGWWESASGARRRSRPDRGTPARGERRAWFAASAGGPAGIGKTRLVLAAGRHGRELGLATLSARGSELERDFAYGLVRQLFEVPLVAASRSEQAELLAGAAGRAAALFGIAGPHDDAADALLDPSIAILHGLFGLCANHGRL